ncbi:hypothetical protein PsYK624_091220 [Phanerochaete sordida]|uniref:C2H2-type domain-containing protein n=1 Tax=Phanerochaete sordida TaxID=48140 RepID=A0A9P3GDM0_9APHY|nr:hypothetical protein PsYK624_091220 [Phanerochaete sordida]
MNASSHSCDGLFAPKHGCSSSALGQGELLCPQLTSDLSNAFAQDSVPPWAAMQLPEDIGSDAAAQPPCIVPSLQDNGDYVVGGSTPIAQEMGIFSAAQVPGEDDWSALFAGVPGGAPPFPFDASHHPCGARSHPTLSQSCYDVSTKLGHPHASVPSPGIYGVAPNAPIMLSSSLPTDVHLDPLEPSLGSQSGPEPWNMPDSISSHPNNPYLTPPLSPFPLPSAQFANSVAGGSTSSMSLDLSSTPYWLPSPVPTALSPSIPSDAFSITTDPEASSSPANTMCASGKRKRSPSRSSSERAPRKSSPDSPDAPPSSPPSPPQYTPSQYTGRFRHLAISRHTSRLAQLTSTSLPAPLKTGDAYACPVCARPCRDRSGAQRHIRAHFRGEHAGFVCAGVRIAADDPRTRSAAERCWEDDAGQVWFGGCWSEMSRRDALRRHARLNPVCRQGLPPI